MNKTRRQIDKLYRLHSFQVTLVIYGCLFVFESLTATMLVCGVAAQVLHYALLQNFPYFAVTSPAFIGAVGKYKT